jgi:tagatose 6-phosphate kinase
MILAVALNPALDITHEVDGADWSGVNRPTRVHSRPGGKGVNVARTLRALGARVHVLGLAGGVTGAAVEAGLAALGVPATFTPISGETRRTFTVVDSRRGEAAVFNEPGPRVCHREYEGWIVTYEKKLPEAAAVVLSGSLPPGLPPETYAGLVGRAAAARVPALLDTHGEALARGAAARPAIVKPNLAELAALAGGALDAGEDLRWVAAAAEKLKAAGPGAVVATLGAAGLCAVTADGTWRATPPAEVAGNATGAGDAVAAGLVHGLVLGHPWAERLRHAVALGTAAAGAPVAGEFSAQEYERLLPAVTVSQVR